MVTDLRELKLTSRIPLRIGISENSESPRKPVLKENVLQKISEESLYPAGSYYLIQSGTCLYGR